MKKRVGIIIGCFLMVALVIVLIVIVSLDKEPINNEIVGGNGQTGEITNGAPSKLDKNEKDVSEKKQQELFNFIPKVYAEGIAPFDSSFMLDAVMSKIIDTNEELDFSVNNVDSTVKKIFERLIFSIFSSIFTPPFNNKKRDTYP